MDTTIQIQTSGQACGATITGVDFSKPMTADEVSQTREAWLQHHVLVFPDQEINDDDLERFI